MNKNLQHIAGIQFGTSVKKSKDGNIIYFQVSDIEEDGSVIFDTVTFADQEQIDESDYLVPGDILLPAKGTKLTSVIVSEDFMPAVASSSLFVIRIKDEKISPEYLQWYLNLSGTQWELQKYATGTNIPSLSIRDLRKFNILVPALDTQQKILTMRKLQIKEEELAGKISKQRKKLVNAISKEMITKEINS